METHSRPHSTNNATSETRAARHKRTTIHLVLILAGSIATLAFLRVFAGGRPPMLNVEWWNALAAAMAKHGFFNVWTPYPPVFPALFYGLSGVVPQSAILPIWKTANACLLLGQALLVFAIVRRCSFQNKQRALHAALLASFAFLVVMFQPNSRLLLGPWMDQFDYLPTLLMLLGLFLLINKSGTASALVCGIGIMTKVFPVILVPAAFAALGWKRGLQYAAVAAVVCVIIAAPFFIANGEMFLSTYRWSADRIPWESVWAYAFPGRGIREPLANLPQAANPELIEQQFAVAYHPPDPGVEGDHAPGRSVWVNYLTAGLTAIGVVLTAAFVARGKKITPHRLCRGALVMVLLLLIFSKGFSSYFIVWAAPLVCIAYPGAGGFALCALMLLLGNTELMGITARSAEVFGNRDALEQFTRLGSPYVLFWRSIVYREALLVVIAGHQIIRLWRSREVTE